MQIAMVLKPDQVDVLAWSDLDWFTHILDETDIDELFSN